MEIIIKTSRPQYYENGREETAYILVDTSNVIEIARYFNRIMKDLFPVTMKNKQLNLYNHNKKRRQILNSTGFLQHQPYSAQEIAAAPAPISHTLTDALNNRTISNLIFNETLQVTRRGQTNANTRRN